MTSFTASTESFLEALTAIAAVVPNKPSRDILKCLKIKAEQGKTDSITLFATDLTETQTYATYKLSENVLVQTQGEFVVVAATLLDYIKTLEGERISITATEDELLKISESAGGADLEVGLQDLQEFPEFPTVPTKADWVSLSLKDMQWALSQVLFAVAERGHPKWGALSSVSINLGKTTLDLAGTDQHRASVVELTIPAQNHEGTYLVAASALEMLSKVFTADFQMLPNTSNNIIFKNDVCTLFVRLVSGEFPPIKKFIPKHPNHVDLSVSELTKQVKKAALAVDQHNTLKIEIKDEKIRLLTKTREQRKGAKIEGALAYKGSGIQFAVNCKYLLDLLKAANNGEALVLHFNQNNQAILFTQQNFKHVMVPQETR